MSLVEEILEKLVGFDTVSDKSNLEIISYIKDFCSARGAKIDLIPNMNGDKCGLVARFGPAETGGVLLSGHTDVVPVTDQDWNYDPFQLTETDGLIYGRGSCDMKGFIACTLAFAPIYAETNLNRDIHFSFTFDEETACLGAPILIEELKKRNIKDGICIIGEPTKMKIIDAHKGCYEYTTYFEGLAGHSSAPHKGVSAVEFATRYANKLIELREDLKKRAPKDSIFDPPFSTLQVGGIFGGIAHNVIADKCHINWETRPVIKEDGIFLNEQIDKYANEVLLPEMKKVFENSKITKKIIGEVTGFDRVKKSEACELVASLTGDNSREVVSFGTEAGLFQEIGISTVVCGPGSIEQAHKVDEFIELNELKKCINFLNGIKSKSISN